MFIKSILAAAVLALASFGAQADSAPLDVTNLGTLSTSTPTTFQKYTSEGSFVDYFTFKLPVNGGSDFGVKEVGELKMWGEVIFNTKFTSISLWSNSDGIVGNGDDQKLDILKQRGDSLSLSFEAMSLGSYFLKVAGSGTGELGGFYKGTINVDSVTAVPEPETYAMLLAGLGLMGTIARRRNQLKSA